MTFVTILSHLGSIVSLGRAVENLIAEIAQKKSVPDCQSIDAVLEAVRKLFDDGVINIPGLDDKLVAGAIQQIEDQLKAKP